MTARSKRPSETKRLKALLDDLPVGSAHIGGWAPPVNGIPTLGFNYSAAAIELVETLYKGGWIQPFDWMAYYKTVKRYEEHPELLGRARLPTIIRLITAYVRADRFVEGQLASVLGSGHLQAIVRRGIALVESRTVRVSRKKPEARRRP